MNMEKNLNKKLKDLFDQTRLAEYGGKNWPTETGMYFQISNKGECLNTHLNLVSR